MKLFFGNDLIEFYCLPEFWDVIPKPQPAFKVIPDWFKKLSNTVPGSRDHFGSESFSAKKCMPLLDVMSLGFVIPLFGDTNIRVSKDGKFIEAGPNSLAKVIDFHDIGQLGGSSSPTYPGPAVKFINHWFIKTAPGYSCLFVPPMNNFETRFTCLSGLVDTDIYPREINFPAVWHAKDYDDKLTAGTPIVTVIPIIRKDMVREAKVRQITEKENYNNSIMERKQASRASVYTNEMRVPKK
jgi:hypothetical protein